MSIPRELQNQLLDVLLQLPVSSANIPAVTRVDTLMFGLPESLIRSVPRHDDALPHVSAMITHARRWSDVEEHPDVLIALVENALRVTDSNKIKNKLIQIRGAMIRGIESSQALDTSSLPEGFERQIVSSNELLTQSMLANAFVTAKSVARIKIPISVNDSANAGDHVLGTGWMITPNYLLTNHHVVAADIAQLGEQVIKSRIQAGVAWFNYVSYDMPYHEFRLKELLACDVELDYALINVDAICTDKPEETLERQGFLKVYTERPTLGSTSRLNVIQHPGGGIRKFGIRSNHYMEMKNQASPFMQYTTHTEAGSSGSPVLTEDWKVVALHHRWVQVDEHLYHGEVIFYHNQGIFLDSILKDIRLKTPSVFEQICSYQISKF